MIESFPKTLPTGYRRVLVPDPGKPPTLMIFDAQDRKIGSYTDRGESHGAAWKAFLDGLGYVGVSNLIAALEADTEKLKKDRDVSEEVQQLQKEIEDLRTALDLQVQSLQADDSEGSETPETDAVTDEAPAEDAAAEEAPNEQAELWRKRCEAAEKDLKEEREMSEKRRERLVELLAFKDAMDKANAALRKVGSEWELKKLVKEPEKKPVDPAWDFKGPIPDKAPEGYEIKDRGERKALRFLLTGPEDLETPCFTKELALEKAWGMVREANKAKADAGECPPEFIPEKPPELPPGFKESFVGGHQGYKLTLPNNTNRFFATPQQLHERAWEIHKEEKAKPAATDRTQAPPGYTFAFVHGKKAEFRLWLPSNGAPRQHIDFISGRARLVAAWLHKETPIGERMKTIRGMEVFPSGWENKLPPGYSVFYNATMALRYILKWPDDTRRYYKTIDERRMAAWDHWRLSITDDGKSDPVLTKALAAPPEEDRSKLPDGYTQKYLGMSVNEPYQVKMYGGPRVAFPTWRKMVQAAWDHKDSDDKVGAPPTNYILGVLPQETQGYYSRTPDKNLLYKGESKQKAYAAAWAHYNKVNGNLDAGNKGDAKPASELPVAANEASQKDEYPPGYTESYLGKCKEPYRVRLASNDFKDFATHEQGLSAAWAHYNQKQAEKAGDASSKTPAASEGYPPGYTETNLGKEFEKPYRVNVKGYNPTEFETHEQAISAAWAHYTEKNPSPQPPVELRDEATAGEFAAGKEAAVPGDPNSERWRELREEQASPSSESKQPIDESKELPKGYKYKKVGGLSASPHLVTGHGLTTYAVSQKVAYARAWKHYRTRKADALGFYIVDETKSLPPGISHEESGTQHTVKADHGNWFTTGSDPKRLYARAWERYYHANPELADLRDGMVDRETTLPSGYFLDHRHWLYPPYQVRKGTWNTDRVNEDDAIAAAWKHYDCKRKGQEPDPQESGLDVDTWLFV